MIDLTQFEGHAKSPWYVGTAIICGSSAIVSAEGNIVATTTSGWIDENIYDKNRLLLAAAPDLKDEVARLREEREEICDAWVQFIDAIQEQMGHSLGWMHEHVRKVDSLLFPKSTGGNQ